MIIYYHSLCAYRVPQTRAQQYRYPFSLRVVCWIDTGSEQSTSVEVHQECLRHNCWQALTFALPLQVIRKVIQQYVRRSRYSACFTNCSFTERTAIYTFFCFPLQRTAVCCIIQQQSVSLLLALPSPSSQSIEDRFDSQCFPAYLYSVSTTGTAAVIAHLTGITSCSILRIYILTQPQG